MKIFILFLFLLISSIELRRHEAGDDDLYELEDLLNDKFDRQKYRPNKQYRPDQNDDVDDDGNDNQYFPSIFKHKKVYPSRKKVLEEDPENDDTPDRLLPEILDQNDESDTSSCLNKYDIRPEQLVKVKELKNGADMIRYISIDKRTLSSDLTVKDSCMVTCCSEKTCDLAMLSEQPTHEGYKCYLFACNGSCPLASHQDYTVMIPKKDSAFYTKLETTKADDKSSIATTTLSNVKFSKKKSFFQETTVISFLIFGIISTIILFILLYYYCREYLKRGRRPKNYAVDADYLINGLYL